MVILDLAMEDKEAAQELGDSKMGIKVRATSSAMLITNPF